MAAGATHSCALDTDGTITCWGNNECFGLIWEPEAPQPQGGQTDAPDGTCTAVSAGGAQSCALATDNTVSCWGLLTLGARGTAERPDGAPPVSSRRVAVSGSGGFPAAGTIVHVAPVTSADAVHVAMGEVVEIAVLGNDYDPNGNLVVTSLSITAAPTSGTALAV